MKFDGRNPLALTTVEILNLSASEREEYLEARAEAVAQHREYEDFDTGEDE